ncbi:MAG: hypothetical protein ACKVWR_04420 [Acidimicrobiales bacterium]
MAAPSGKWDAASEALPLTHLIELLRATWDGAAISPARIGMLIGLTAVAAVAAPRLFSRI